MLLYLQQIRKLTFVGGFGTSQSQPVLDAWSEMRMFLTDLPFMSG